MNKPHLSPRENQVIRCIFDGMGNREIAKTLGIKPRTVKRHKERLYIKFDIDNRWIKHVRLVWILSGGTA